MTHSELIDQARTCLQILNDPTAPTRERDRCAAWISAEPENREAYLSVARAQGQIRHTKRPDRGRVIYIALMGAIAFLAGCILIELL